MTSEILEHTFDTGTVAINYAEIANDKPSLVLIHGGGGQWDSVQVLMESFSAEFHIYAPDLRGHGKSGRSHEPYTLQNYTADIIAFLQHVVQQPAIIFGHSMGGMVALMAAAQSPDLVHALIIGDSPLTAASWVALLKPGRSQLQFHSDLSGGTYSEDEIIAKLGDSFVGPRQWMAHNFVCLDPNVLGILANDPERAATGYELIFPAVKCPTLLIQSDPAAGGLMTDVGVTLALQHLANPAHVMLDGISHVLQNEQLEPVLRTMQDFLQTI